MNQASQTLPVSRGPYQLHTEVIPGTGVPVVLMHGFPDNTHLYDQLLPHLAGHRPVVLFDFLGWGHSDKPVGYAYTAANQAGDLAAVVGAVDKHFGPGQLVLVAHDASGPPAIDWALDNPGRVATLVLLNTYYHWTPALRRPPAIALYSTPVIRGAARAVVRRRRTWTGACTPGRSAGSSTTPGYAPSSFHSYMSSSCPPGPRSGASTTT
jgi:pimeloyl-ACP methyl ester carboxylesterase